MCPNDPNFDSFEEALRSIAREVSRSAERMSQVDLDQIAESFGVDAARAREWFDSATTWLRSQGRTFGDAPFSDDEPFGAAEPFGAPEPKPAPAPAPDIDPLRNAAPHPLDLPSEEQGLALAALDSGRWTVEPGSNSLSARGDGPRPSDTLGLVRELRARDWITADGEVTLVGRHALSRWLEAHASG